MHYNTIIKLLFFCPLILSSCSTQNGFEGTAKKLDELKSEVVISAKKLKDPWAITVNDSVIAVANNKVSPLVEFYTYDGKLKEKVLEKGKDSLQIEVISNIRFNEGNLIVSDVLSNKILRIDNYTKKIATINTKNIKDPGLILADEKIFSRSTAHPGGRITQYDKNGKFTANMLDLPPKINDSISSELNLSIYGSSLEISPDNTKLALGTFNADMLDILDIMEDSIWTYHYSIPEHLAFDTIRGRLHYYFTSKSKAGYIDIAMSNDYLFGLYSGKNMEDKDSFFSDKLRIVNLKTKKRYLAKLDKPIKSISVTDDNKTIYGIAMDENREPQIVKFKTEFHD